MQTQSNETTQLARKTTTRKPKAKKAPVEAAEVTVEAVEAVEAVEVTVEAPNEPPELRAAREALAKAEERIKYLENETLWQYLARIWGPQE